MQPFQSTKPNVEEEIADIVRSRHAGHRGRPRLDGMPPGGDSASPDPTLTSRNIQIVLEYFGFGDLFLPALEDLADKHGIGTRERVRQIIEANYKGAVGSLQFPAAKAVAAALAERDIWLESEFLAVLQERGLVGSIETAEALLRYITRGNYRDHDERFIVRANCLPPLRVCPGTSCGIA
jgi:hypothetical protein